MPFHCTRRRVSALGLLVAGVFAAAAAAAASKPANSASAAKPANTASAASAAPATPAASVEPVAKPLSLNKATEDQLAKLVGLSAADAAAIISNRPKTGYKSKEDLLDKRILLPKTYEKIKDKVMVP